MKLPDLLTPQAILVVDDDEMLLAVCTDFLESEGYYVLTARNGQKALAVLQMVRPAAMLLDLCMPVVDGLTACALIKTNPQTAQIPVVLMSAQHTLTCHVQENVRADAILPKPFALDVLLQTVEMLTA